MTIMLLCLRGNVPRIAWACGIHAARSAAGGADDRLQLLDAAVEVVVDEHVIVLAVEAQLLARPPPGGA